MTTMYVGVPTIIHQLCTKARRSLVVVVVTAELEEDRPLHMWAVAEMLPYFKYHWTPCWHSWSSFLEIKMNQQDKYTGIVAYYVDVRIITCTWRNYSKQVMYDYDIGFLQNLISWQPSTTKTITSVYRGLFSNLTFPFDTGKQSNLSSTHRIVLELSFSKIGGVHDQLHISSVDWWDILLPQIDEGADGF